MPLKVIVSGAGIAGLALSHWLGRIGATAILIERAPRFQALGHYISLKGNGVEMVRRMGILDACLARAAPLEEVYFYSKARRLLRTERTAALARTLGGYILFRRADLQRALYELVQESTDIRFGTQIVEVRPVAAGVEVSLSDGRIERGDLLVGADGIHSPVRGLVFGAGFEQPLGGHYIAPNPSAPPRSPSRMLSSSSSRTIRPQPAPKGGANRQLVLPRLRPHEQQVRHVGGSDQHHDADGPHQQPQDVAHAADDVLLQGA